MEISFEEAKEKYLALGIKPDHDPNPQIDVIKATEEVDDDEEAYEDEAVQEAEIVETEEDAEVVEDKVETEAETTAAEKTE